MKDYLPLYDVTPFTMQDFPEKTAALVWISGCNMRCGYCHNPCIVRAGAGRFKKEQVLDFLKGRKGLLDGVVLSGGEPTLYKGTPAFAREIRELGFALKLDTNGTRPKIVRQMLDEGLLDFVALDYKAPEGKFKAVTGCKDWAAFSETLDMLIERMSPFSLSPAGGEGGEDQRSEQGEGAMQPKKRAANIETPSPRPSPPTGEREKRQRLSVEIRTTVHTSLLDEDDINAITRDLEKRGYRGAYHIQNYKDPGPTFCDLTQDARTLSREKIALASFPIEFRNF